MFRAISGRVKLTLPEPFFKRKIVPPKRSFVLGCSALFGMVAYSQNYDTDLEISFVETPENLELMAHQFELKKVKEILIGNSDGKLQRFEGGREFISRLPICQVLCHKLFIRLKLLGIRM